MIAFFLSLVGVILLFIPDTKSLSVICVTKIFSKSTYCLSFLCLCLQSVSNLKKVNASFSFNDLVSAESCLRYFLHNIIFFGSFQMFTLYIKPLTHPECFFVCVSGEVEYNFILCIYWIVYYFSICLNASSFIYLFSIQLCVFSGWFFTFHCSKSMYQFLGQYYSCFINIYHNNLI